MVLIIGLPNAGKTTYSKRFFGVVHFDDVKGGRHKWDNVVKMVEADPSIVIEGVYAKASHRKPLIDACKGKKICIWLDTPMDVCVERERTGRKRSEHMVVLAARSFEPPSYEEGWDEIVVIKGDENGRSISY